MPHITADRHTRPHRLYWTPKHNEQWKRNTMSNFLSFFPLRIYFWFRRCHSRYIGFVADIVNTEHSHTHTQKPFYVCFELIHNSWHVQITTLRVSFSFKNAEKGKRTKKLRSVVHCWAKIKWNFHESHNETKNRNKIQKKKRNRRRDSSRWKFVCGMR